LRYTSSVDRAPPEVMGRYAVFGKIASGGMATIHLGRLTGAVGFSRTVALKRLHPHLAEQPEFLRTMIDEARVAVRIHHPNVVQTLDVVEADGGLLVVMEYVRGESLYRLLHAVISAGHRVPIPIASAIALGALHGLHAAHEATDELGMPLGIVHRDVSPQNILVGVDGVARLIDFGVAKAVGRLQSTSQGVVKGKLAYMAPEQLAAQTVTPKADVYAMSIVLWEMLAARRLFVSDDEASLYRIVLDGASTPPSRYAPEVPPDLDALVMTGLAREPDDRFASAREMADVLVRVAPPAFSTEVADWVQSVAGEALAHRAALLAEIESSTAGARDEESAAGPGSIPNVTLRSSRPPKAPGPATTGSHRRRTAAMIAAGLGLLVCVSVWARRGASPAYPTSASPASSSTLPPVASPPAPDPVPSQASQATGAEVPTTASPSPPAAPTPSTAVRARPPARKAPRPASGGSIRYPQPD
jgi:eukaryotic-like serine/threonine-protein kinase